jgi:hypothetical protein
LERGPISLDGVQPHHSSDGWFVVDKNGAAMRLNGRTRVLAGTGDERRQADRCFWRVGRTASQSKSAPRPTVSLRICSGCVHEVLERAHHPGASRHVEGPGGR